MSASPAPAAKATALPRLYLNHLPELDWLIAVEFGRTDDGQPFDRWIEITDEIGILLDEPGGEPVGFAIHDFSNFDEGSREIAEIWDGPRFHAPQLGMPDASIGEIAIAARAMFGDHETVNRAFFGKAVCCDGEEALHYWRCCLEAGDSMAHFALGYTLYSLGRYREAYRHLRYYTEISPAGSWSWCWYGKAAEAIDEPAEAESAYLQAIELEPTSEKTDAGELLAALRAKLD